LNIQLWKSKFDRKQLRKKLTVAYLQHLGEGKQRMMPKGQDCQQHSALSKRAKPVITRKKHRKIMLHMRSVNMLPDSNNHLEVILQGSFDIFLKVKFTSW
jgi:hypothetical protein